jgi:hypothetical protein
LAVWGVVSRGSYLVSEAPKKRTQSRVVSLFVTQPHESRKIFKTSKFPAQPYHNRNLLPRHRNTIKLKPFKARDLLAVTKTSILSLCNIEISIQNLPRHKPPNMAANGDRYGNDLDSDSDSGPGSPGLDAQNDVDDNVPEIEDKPVKSALKKSAQKEAASAIIRPILPPQTEPKDLDVKSLTPLTPEIIARQATINIGTIGHVAHGKSTVVKAISGVQTVRFKNELERNITIKLGYANAKIYKCNNPECPRPTCFRSFKSEKEVDPPCEREGCEGTYELLRHVS